MYKNNTMPIPPNYLAMVNSHERDQYIEFDEGPHIYTVHGEQGYTSVTTFNHSHFPHFNADEVVANIMRGKKIHDPTYKYYGMTAEEIKDLWAKKGSNASSLGTKFHYMIECFYNYEEVEIDCNEFEWFLKFDEDFPELTPYRTEWMIYDQELRLSGSIDMVFELPDGTLQIYDWKRVQEITYEHPFGETATTECIKHLPHSNFWHYALQLNTYRAILQKNYGKVISGLYLVCIHPDNPYKRYERIEVPFLDKEINDLFEYRKKQVEAGTHDIKKH